MIVNYNSDKKFFSKSKVMTILKRKKRLFKKLRRIDKKISKQDSKMFDNNLHSPTIMTELRIQDRIKGFVRVRERCFKNLLSAISTNCKRSSLELNKETIEKACLQFEQKAILASLETSIYNDVMLNILAQIKTSTSQGHLCIAPTIKEENVKSNEHSLLNVNAVSVNEPQPPRCNDSPLPTAKVFPRTIINENLEKIPDSCNPANGIPVSLVKPQTLIEFDNSKEFEEEFPSEQTECSFNLDLKIKQKEQNDNVGVETDNATNSNFLENDELEELLNILEGTDDKNDSRFDKMGGFFGYEEKSDMESSPPVKYHKSRKLEHSCVDSWKNERKSFGNYFGEDSDFEHEDSFNDKETFLSSCARRILPSVVKFVMPYHNDHRILGGSYIFKNLVRRIADSLVDLNNYPSDSQVERYVKNYFPAGKTYHNVTDVWCFMMDSNY